MTLTVPLYFVRYQNHIIIEVWYVHYKPEIITFLWLFHNQIFYFLWNSFTMNKE